MVRLIHKSKTVDSAGSIEDCTVWDVPRTMRNPDGIRYRLAYIPGNCRAPAVLYDNHHPKGHHKHIGNEQFAYDFVDVRKLIEDFQRDIETSNENF